MNLKHCKLQLLLFCLGAVVVCAIAVHAQSGRRKTQPPEVAPVPTPTPEPTPIPKSEQKNSELAFLIVVDRAGGMMSYPFSFYDAVAYGCADRLRAGSSAQVSVTDNSVNRSEAIKKAKAETTGYVVLLKLTNDMMGSSTLPNPNEELVLEYTVYAPGTAKVVTNGRSYENPNRKGPIVVGPTRRRSDAIYREQILKRQGEDAGERILRAMHLNVPVRK